MVYLGLSLGLGSSASSFDGAGAAARAEQDVDVVEIDSSAREPLPSPASRPAIPVLARIRVDLMLDPTLTRSLQMGDRWVSPPTFQHVRQAGRRAKVVARAIGLDYRGKLLNRRLEAEWVAADPSLISVSPTSGHQVTITMEAPGESSLTVINGEVTEVLTLEAIYDERYGMAQLVISKDAS